MPHVNIRELAKELNLSIGTVSKALKDSHEISAETKEKVLRLAESLHYTPNPYASSLRRKKSNTIAVVIPEVADSFFSAALKGIEEIAQTKGYHVLVYLTYESGKKERKILEEFGNGRVDGVLLSVSSETSSAAHLDALQAAKVPLVFFDRVMESVNAAKVRTDDFESGYTATQHLLEQGCHRIAYLFISPLLDINNKRLAGYRKAVADAGLSATEEHIVQCTNDTKTNESVLLELLNSPNKPDGVIASVEKLILPLYSMCTQLGLAVPADVKAVAFSNLATAAILRPSLTTVTQPAFDMGKAAATLLFTALEKRNYPWRNEDVVLPSELCVRESSK